MSIGLVPATVLTSSLGARTFDRLVIVTATILTRNRVSDLKPSNKMNCGKFWPSSHNVKTLGKTKICLELLYFVFTKLLGLKLGSNLGGAVVE